MAGYGGYERFRTRRFLSGGEVLDDNKVVGTQSRGQVFEITLYFLVGGEELPFSTSSAPLPVLRPTEFHDYSITDNDDMIKRPESSGATGNLNMTVPLPTWREEASSRGCRG